jgi:hypothetical protein
MASVTAAERRISDPRVSRLIASGTKKACPSGSGVPTIERVGTLGSRDG